MPAPSRKAAQIYYLLYKRQINLRKTTFCALEYGFYKKNAIFAMLLTSLAKRS
jgi:hypothetical protein